MEDEIEPHLRDMLVVPCGQRAAVVRRSFQGRSFPR